MRHYDLMFTGSRSCTRESHMHLLLQKLSHLKNEFGISSAVSGGAQGFDALAVEACRRLDIPCDILFPTSGYADYYWLSGKGGPRNVQGYDEMLDDCAVSGGSIHCMTSRPYKGVNLDRNIAMVNSSNRVLVGAQSLTVLSGGTSHAVRSARSAGRIIHTL